GEREQGEGLHEQAREAVREAERAVEGARREAARVGAELAAANQFLRSHAAAPNGAAALSDDLEVDAGCEHAVAAALDGRLGAPVVEHRGAAGELLDRAGANGGRALVLRAVDGERPASLRGAPGPRVASAPAPGAERLLDHVRGDGRPLALARALLADVWLVDDLGSVGDEFDGVAVTRSGRVWSSHARELRQAPAVGEDRVLAERNRRDRLVRDSERAAQAELDARAGLERAGTALAQAESERERLTVAHRAAVRGLDEAGEEQRRLEAQIQRRRSAPDDGPAADRRAQLQAELAAEQRLLERAQRERAERERRLDGTRATAAADHALIPVIAALITALEQAQTTVAEHVTSFERALASDREAGEHMTAELRGCAQREAQLHAQLGRENEELTRAEVRLQRARDQATDAEAELTRIAQRLQVAPEPAPDVLSAEERAALDARLERVARRREQLGPVNPLAQDEYAEALAHVEELEAQRGDLETALRELQKLIADTDRQIRTSFEQTFAATAAAFEELAADLFPGGKGRLRLVSDESPRQARVLGGQAAGPDGADNAAPGDEEAAPEDEDTERAEEDLLGVEIEITPAGKECKRLSLLSGGEKSMTALAFLFAVFLARPCPFYILDEVEAALDDLNIDRFLALLRRYSPRAQFIVVTHQKRTMEAADSLYGVSMGSDGVSKVISRRLAAVEAAA
ncbi:MAG: hypothetical protein ACRDMJ_08070, partial [Solirubrobacteraceae bacterium]